MNALTTVAEVGAGLALVTGALAKATDLAGQLEKLKGALGTLRGRRPPSRPAGSVPDIRSPRYVGRGRELDRLTALVAGPQPRVTVVAPAGWGKRRLAVTVAQALARSRSGRNPRFADHVWYLDLRTLADSQHGHVDPDLLAREVATQQGLHDVSSGQLHRQLMTLLATRSVLLVWANCDRLADQSRELSARWLASCPRVGILATSERPLGVDGEQCFELPPMTHDSDPDDGRPAARLRTLEAVQLFEVVAAGTGGGPADLGDDELRGAARICSRLGGVPCAVMIAAARVATGVTVADVEQDLGDAGEPLVAAFTATYAALGDTERAVCRSLAVFAGSFTMAAAKSVCATSRLEGSAVPAAVARLVEARLLHRLGPTEAPHHADGEARFRMIPAVQDAAGSLLGRAEEKAARLRHAGHYAALVDGLRPVMTSARREEAFGRLERDLSNVRGALSWAPAHGQHDLSLSMSGGLFWFWNLTGHLGEGWTTATRVLRLAGEAGAPPSRALGTYGAGGLAFLRGDHTAAESLLTTSVQLWRQAHGDGDDTALGLALVVLAMTRLNRGEQHQAEQQIREAVTILDSAGDPFGRALARGDLGQVAEGAGDLERAATAYGESLELWRAAGDAWGEALTLGNAGQLATCRHEYDRAESLLGSALALQTGHRDQWGRARTLMRLGHLAWHRACVARDRGDRAAERRRLAEAAGHYRESLVEHQRLERQQLVCECLEGLAHIAAASGDCPRAGRLYGGAQRLRAAVGARRSAMAEEEFTAARAAGCSGADLAQAEGEGAALSLDAVCADAQRVLVRA